MRVLSVLNRRKGWGIGEERTKKWLKHFKFFARICTFGSQKGPFKDVNILDLYMGHNFSSDTSPKNEVVRPGLRFGWLESYLMVLSTKFFFSFWQIFAEIGGEGRGGATLILLMGSLFFKRIRLISFYIKQNFTPYVFFSLFRNFSTGCNHFWKNPNLTSIFEN